MVMFGMDLRPMAWITVLLPAIGFLAIFASYLVRRDNKKSSWWTDGGAIFGVATIGGSAVLSLLIFLQVWMELGPYHSDHPWVWMRFSQYDAADPNGGFFLGSGLQIDGLSSLLMVIVSFLSTCIAIYSTAYMHEEKALHRYFFEIMLFITGMMGMVVVDNYLFAFIFWEMMGLCSYLLIGYWYTKPSASSAAKKAFLVTRVGDVFFLFGILLLFDAFHTLSYRTIFEEALGPGAQVTAAQLDALKWAGLFIFGGAVGKSAQFPLHVWLPDAMEGPTTVSALIHAATMVKAGVYITARTLPILALFPQTLALIALIGGITALMAATMALVVHDIKRVLAYSTISQLAYMFMAIGTLGIGPAIFHLMNHAFFKAQLFLGSGSVIHGTGTQDMRQMGGLKDKMPWTYRTMLVGSLSLAGFPFVSGWWSKDEILSSVAAHAGEVHGEWVGPLFGVLHVPYATLAWTVFGLGMVTAFLTAFYTFRMVYLTFHGKPRYDEHEVHVHEAPAPMRNVLIVLAIFALVSGGVTAGLSWIYPNGFERMMVDEFLEGKVTEVPSLLHLGEWALNPVMWAGTALALAGLLLAYVTYAKGWVDIEAFVGLPRPGAGAAAHGVNRLGRALHRVFTAKWGMDWLFLRIAALGDNGIAAFSDFIDRRIFDGATFGLGRGAFAGSRTLQRAADGIVRNYATWIVGGLALLLFAMKFIVPASAGGG